MIKTQYMLISFGKVVTPEPIVMGDMITNKAVFGILEQICLLCELDIPDLEAEDAS